MKKYIFIFLILSSCSNESEYPKLIVGTWEHYSSENIKAQGQSTYNVNGKIISFSYDKPKEKYIHKYKITGNVICSKLLSTPTPQYTHVGYEECVDIKSLNNSELVTTDANMEVNTFVRKN